MELLQLTAASPVTATCTTCHEPPLDSRQPDVPRLFASQDELAQVRTIAQPERPALLQRAADAFQGALLFVGVATIEDPDTNRERKVKRRLTGGQRKVFDRHAAQAHVLGF